MKEIDLYIEKYEKNLEQLLIEFYEVLTEAYKKGSKFTMNVDSNVVKEERFVYKFITEIYNKGVKDGKLQERFNVK